MKEVLELKLNYDKTIKENQTLKDELDKIVESISSMDLTELNNLLIEELKSDKLGKYYLLAVLRDLFQQFKNLGDDELSIESGGCLMNCYESSCNVINIRGNKSQYNFAFVIEKDKAVIAGIHSCILFQNTSGKIITPTEELLSLSLKKQQEMLKKDTGKWDEEGGIEMTRSVFKLFKAAGQSGNPEDVIAMMNLIKNLTKS